MKSLFFFVALCLSIAIQASGVIITFSPDNPIVGQPVNFTSGNSCSTYQLDPGDGSGIINANSSSILHTYTTLGNYTPNMGCNGSLNPIVSTEYRNSSGVVTSFVVGAAATSAIPTLGEWGLIILGIIILGIGLVSMRQKRIVAIIE